MDKIRTDLVLAAIADMKAAASHGAVLQRLDSLLADVRRAEGREASLVVACLPDAYAVGATYASAPFPPAAWAGQWELPPPTN